MFDMYIEKIESSLKRPLTQSEKNIANEFCASGKPVSYAVYYFE
jgi:hypothetical protein